MLLKRNKAISTLIYGILLTSFVTACVKNGSKNEKPGEVALKTLELTEVSQAQLNGTENIMLTEESEIAAASLIQNYVFTTSEIRTFRVRQGEIANSLCSASGPFEYSFSLKGPDGIERPIHSRRNPELLVPGEYRLKVELENGSLCNNISMEIVIDSTVREDLEMTKNEIEAIDALTSRKMEPPYRIAM